MVITKNTFTHLCAYVGLMSSMHSHELFKKIP